MGKEKKKIEKNDDPADEAVQNIPKIGKVIIDEKTGTLTLQVKKEKGRKKKEE